MWALLYFILFYFDSNVALHVWWVYLVHPNLHWEMQYIDLFCLIHFFFSCSLGGLLQMTLCYLFMVICLINMSSVWQWVLLQNGGTIIVMIAFDVWSFFMVWLLYCILSNLATCILWLLLMSIIFSFLDCLIMYLGTLIFVRPYFTYYLFFILAVNLKSSMVCRLLS